MDTQASTAAPDEAAAFTSTETVATFAGQEITVRPLNVQQVIQLSRILRAVLPALDRAQGLLSADIAEAGTDELAVLMDLLADYGDPLTEGVALAIGKPVDFIRQADDFAGLFGLIAAIVRINSSFFGQQAGQRLAGLRNGAASGDGRMPSNPLSPPATL